MASNIELIKILREIDTSRVALFAANVSASAGSALKCVMKGVAKPFVTCNDIPRRPENMKNIAILLDLNSLKASSPRISAIDFLPLLSWCFSILHWGSEKQYAKRTMLRMPDTRNCRWVYWNLLLFSAIVRVNAPSFIAAQFTNHMVIMNPTVPNTLIGGKSFTVSSPWFCRILNATVLDNARVGM